MIHYYVFSLNNYCPKNVCNFVKKYKFYDQNRDYCTIAGFMFLHK